MVGLAPVAVVISLLRLLQVLLTILPNGDWTDHNNIEIFVGDQTTIDEVECTQIIGDGLIEALCLVRQYCGLSPSGLPWKKLLATSASLNVSMVCSAQQ